MKHFIGKIQLKNVSKILRRRIDTEKWETSNWIRTITFVLPKGKRKKLANMEVLFSDRQTKDIIVLWNAVFCKYLPNKKRNWDKSAHVVRHRQKEVNHHQEKVTNGPKTRQTNAIRCSSLSFVSFGDPVANRCRCERQFLCVHDVIRTVRFVSPKAAGKETNAIENYWIRLCAFSSERLWPSQKDVLKCFFFLSPSSSFVFFCFCLFLFVICAIFFFVAFFSLFFLLLRRFSPVDNNSMHTRLVFAFCHCPFSIVFDLSMRSNLCVQVWSLVIH